MKNCKMVKIEDIKNKTYIELNQDERDFLENLIDKYNLSLEQENIIYLSFLFDETIKDSIKKLDLK